jgi:predicted lipoprotein with Yx(FWY)xxD motif
VSKGNLILAIFGILAILVISGCTQQQPTVQQTPVQQTSVQQTSVQQTSVQQTPAIVTPVAQPTIEQPKVKLSLENYIVDSKGITLYIFTNDVMGDSKCTGGCNNIWPFFYQENLTVASGLNSSDFGTITRDDGQKQTTYKGWPLYYFSNDVNPGDIKGDGVNKIWFIARPDYTVFIADKDNMTFIVDAKGNTLYHFAKDMPGVSNCTGNCLQTWPVFYNENIVAPSVMNTSDFGVITNSEGSKQTTYKQMPLYYYINDTKRGDTNGQGVINAWSVVGPEATPVPTIITQSPVPTQSMGGGGGGY